MFVSVHLFVSHHVHCARRPRKSWTRAHTVRRRKSAAQTRVHASVSRGQTHTCGPRALYSAPRFIGHHQGISVQWNSVIGADCLHWSWRSSLAWISRTTICCISENEKGGVMSKTGLPLMKTYRSPACPQRMRSLMRSWRRLKNRT